MLLIDEADWPLVLVRWEAPVSGTDIDLYRERFQSWLRRQVRFAVFSVQSLVDEPGEGHERIHSRAWVKALRLRISQRCVGIATLVSESGVSDAWAQAHAQHAGRLLGCPVRSFFDSDEALLWLRERLRQTQPQIALPASLPVR